MAKIGEMKCSEMECVVCPFNKMPIGFCLDFKSGLTLNEGFKELKRYMTTYKQEAIRKILNKKYKVLEVTQEEGEETNE